MRELSVSEQHNQGLGAEREVADLPAEFLATDGSAEITNNSDDAGEAQVGKEAPKTAAGASGGLAKLVEERTEKRDRDEDREETSEEAEGEEQVAAAAAGGSEAPVDIVAVVESLDGISETFARAGEPAGKNANALGDDGSPSALLLGLGALGLVGAAIVIAADGDDDDVSLPPPPPPPPPANTAPTITSDAAFAVDENLAADTEVFTVTATDAENDPVTYALSGDNADAFAIDPATGVITLVAPLDFEALDQNTLAVTVTATDDEGAETTQDITVTVNDVNEAPTITSGDTFDIDENLEAGTVVFTATAVDPDADDTITFSLSGDDADAFAIDADTGIVTLAGPLDFETQNQFTVTVNATDAAGLVATQDVTIDVNDVEEQTVVSLDVDSDGNIVTAEPFSGADDDFIFTDSADVESNAEITGFGLGDIIRVDTDTSAYSFTTVNDGSSAEFDDLLITLNNAGVVSQIILQDVIDAGTFVSDEASAEAAFGADFFVDGDVIPAPTPTPTPTPPPPPPPPPTGGAGGDEVVDGDDDTDGNISTPVTFDAADSAITFIDDADIASNFIIQNVSADDLVQFLNVDPSEVSYTSDGTDLLVSFNNDGVVSTITLEDAVSEDDFIFDEASAEAALGNAFNGGVPLDFFQAG
jgi:hypothetical protein